MTRPTSIDRIKEALDAGPTPGPWEVPHLSRDDVTCNCTGVLSGGYLGGICSISVNNGIPMVSEGGNDAPPLREAKANGLLIAACNPSASKELLAYVEGLERDAARYRWLVCAEWNADSHPLVWEALNDCPNDAGKSAMDTLIDAAIAKDQKP